MIAPFTAGRAGSGIRSLFGLGGGRLSRRLTGAFVLIIAVLAVVVIVVASSITTASIEARAESQLLSDEAIVQLSFQQLEGDLVFLDELLTSSQMLTDELSVPSASRSLMISLMSDVRHRGMKVRMYDAQPGADQPDSSIIRKGFLGMRTVGLAIDRDEHGSTLRLVSVAPVETEQGVERVIAVSFALTSAYIESISKRIGSDITMLLPDGEVISTLGEPAAAALAERLKERDGLAPKEEEPRLFPATLAGTPTKNLMSSFAINLKKEGRLVLTMPMTDLLAAKRSIVSRMLGITVAFLAGASLLYLSLIRRITRPLAHLSAATRDVAAGNLDLRVSVASADEVGELADSFNGMIQRLRESREEIERWNQTLEQRVEDRTRSLELARSQLKAANAQLVQALDELQRTQDKMVRTEKLAALGQMASAIAHEVRNPLAGMRGALQVLSREQVYGDRGQVIPLVIQQIDRLSDTTSRLLSFARRATPHQVPCDITGLIHETRLLVAEQAAEKGVKIAVDLEPVDRLFSVDPQLTVQAFLNIALNAVQAMGRGGTLTMATKWNGDAGELHIRFEDTGDGMAPAVLEKIFTPFFTTKHQGTGLGLYVAKEIIEQEGGSLHVSSAPGVGTTFTVRLRAREEGETAALA